MPTATLTLFSGVHERHISYIVKNFRAFSFYYDIGRRLPKCNYCHDTFWWWESSCVINKITGKLQNFEGTLVCHCEDIREELFQYRWKFLDHQKQHKRILKFFK